MKIFCSFLIVFLFSVISVAQNYNEVVFDYPDNLCPDIEDIVIRSDNNGQVNLSEFLNNAKECLDQFDYDDRSFIRKIAFELEVLCDNDTPSCLENLKASISEVVASLSRYQQARILYPYGYQKVGELNEYDEYEAELVLQNEETCTCSDSSLATMLICNFKS